MGFKDTFISNMSGLAGYLPQMMKRIPFDVLLPFYHAVSDSSIIHIKHLYPHKTEKQFTQDLEYLLKYYQPIDLEQFGNIKSGAVKSTRPNFLLSFDDGLQEFYTVVAPILKRKGVPAVCFLNSGFIDNKDLFFRYKASLLIEQLDNNGSLAHTSELKDWLSERNREKKSLQEYILSIKYSKREELDQLADLMHVSYADYLDNEQPYLSELQIKELINQGFYFGAHSIDHPEYQYLSVEEQLRQTVTSIENVCHRFNLDYKLFSFPFTDYKVKNIFFNLLRKEIEIDFTFGCAGLKEESIISHIQRVSFEFNNLPAKQILDAESLYYKLSKFTGKHIINRS